MALLKQFSSASKPELFGSPRLTETQRRKSMHDIIRRARFGGMSATINEQVEFEHNPSLEFDARGRLLRWVK